MKMQSNKIAAIILVLYFQQCNKRMGMYANYGDANEDWNENDDDDDDEDDNDDNNDDVDGKVEENRIEHEIRSLILLSQLGSCMVKLI